MGDHDHAYKAFFSHERMVYDLLRGFVHEEWLAQLDYHSLERVNGSYVSDSFRERSNDLVWRVRWGKEWLYVYLLLEFQSSVDKYMALRLLTYVGLLYEDLVRQKKLAAGGLLPPVLPIVLYNGSKPWTAAKSLESLIVPGVRGLEQYQPTMRYLLIDEADYQGIEPSTSRNLVAALFQLEHSRSAREMDSILGALIDWLEDPAEASLRRAFAVWIRRVILARFPGAEQLPNTDDLQEIRPMLADRIQEWAEEAKREGWQKGLQEGRQAGLQEGRQAGLQEGRQAGLQEGRQAGLEAGREEGLQEGEARLLLRQLRARFGELPPWVEGRVTQASSPQLEEWGERLVKVDSLNAVFSD